MERDSAGDSPALLYLGEEHLLAAAKRNGEINVGKVSDRALLPSGALAP